MLFNPICEETFGASLIKLNSDIPVVSHMLKEIMTQYLAKGGKGFKKLVALIGGCEEQQTKESLHQAKTPEMLTDQVEKQLEE